MSSLETPKGAEIYEWGSYYKIGLHDKPYYFDGSWKKSDKDASEVSRRISYRINLERATGKSRFASDMIEE